MDKLSPQTHTTVNVFRFDPHPRRKQLTIIGEIAIAVVRNGIVLKEFSEPFKKTVQLISLTHTSRVDSIVKDILQACPFIEDSNSLWTSLKETVKEISNREYDANGIVVTSCRASDGSYLPRHFDVFDEIEASPSFHLYPPLETDETDISKISQYLEMLYEDNKKKVEGLRLIAQLTKYNRHLVVISEHASALNAIIRTLREDRESNMNLTHCSFSICFDFARFGVFHRLLIRHKVHPLILDKIDYEQERYEKWKLQLHKKEMNARATNSSEALEMLKTAKDNFQVRVELQNKILQSGFAILHHLSEDRLVSKTLLHQGIITSLTDSLDHTDFHLWETVLTFLKDLSLFNEYIEQMINVNTLEKIVKILKCKIAIPKKVARVSFALLCNLSFHPKLRHDMVNKGLLSVFAKCLSKSSFSDIIAKTLYIISNEVSYRDKINQSGIAETLLAQLTQASKEDAFEKVSRIKGALAVNLAKDPRGAKIMGECANISILIKHSIKAQDVLGMKIIRNVAEACPSSHVDQQAGHIAKAVVEVNSLDFVVECIGTLAHTNPETVNFPDILKKNRVHTWLKRHLLRYMNVTDIVEITHQLKTATLEIVILLSNICKREEGSRFLVGEGFIDQILIRLLNEPHTDPQIVQQCIYLFNLCCSHAAVAKFLITKTQFPQELLVFALRIGGKLRWKNELTLHKLSEHSEAWLETMMEHEFLVYNEKWATEATKEFDKENEESPELPSLLKNKTDRVTDYQILHDLIKGSRSPYNSVRMNEDEDELECTNNSVDDSATDDDSMFPSFSLDLPFETLGGAPHFYGSGSANKISQLYWEEFGDDSNSDWTYSLK